MSGVRLLRHYHIEVPTICDLDLKLTCRQAATLSDVLRCSPHFVRNMTQSRGGTVRSRLIAIWRPPQICRSCARRHDANAVTRGARLRSWMEGWRITCPICGTPLEEFRLFMRLIRAGPADPLLVQNGCNAHDGELIMDRASRRHGGGSDYAVLMRSLLSRQAPRTTVREDGGNAPVARSCRPRFRELLPAAGTGKLALRGPAAAAECAYPSACWRCSGVEMSWALDRQTGRRCRVATPGGSSQECWSPRGLEKGPGNRSSSSRYCCKIWNPPPSEFQYYSKRHPIREPALFHQFSAT